MEISIDLDDVRGWVNAADPGQRFAVERGAVDDGDSSAHLTVDDSDSWAQGTGVCLDAVND